MLERNLKRKHYKEVLGERIDEIKVRNGEVKEKMERREMF
jgi:hypothetical protein